MKAQLSLEFIVMMAMAMILLTIFIFIGNELLQSSRQEERYTGLRDLGGSIQSEIILAARAERGYNRTFWLPDKMGEINYTIKNTNNTFYLEYKSARFNFYIPTITGNITKGFNNILTNQTTIWVKQP